MTNVDRAGAVLAALRRAGVATVCVCPGARNAPLVEVVSRALDLDIVHAFEERAAAFFALGRIKATGRPAAVVTTSGTAAAELLPALVEAHYARLPLVAVTADRPRRFRGSGAPQSIEQVGIFGGYVERCLDLARGEPLSLASWSRARPLHLNVCFDEPLIDGPLPPPSPAVPVEPGPVEAGAGPALVRDALARFAGEARRPLVIAGDLDPAQADAVAGWLRTLAAPVYAEAHSHLRGHAALGGLLLRGGERMVRWALERRLCDGVLRLGGVPTLRAWRDLEGALAAVPVLSLSRRPFTGASRGALVHHPAGEAALVALAGPPRAAGECAETAEVFAVDRRQEARLAAALSSYPRGEPALVRALSTRLSSESWLYLGNSLPIREWDLAASHDSKPARVADNRGANGIDGQLATFLGMAAPGHANVALVGDLTALYDASAPWFLRGRAGLDATIVVMHNGGGRIFDRMFPGDAFTVPHEVDFAPWAAEWGLAFSRWDGEVPATIPVRGHHVVELRPARGETQAFWQAYDASWKDA